MDSQPIKEAQNIWLQWQIIVTVIGAIVAVGLSIFSSITGLRQRKRELRWKQAELGRNIVDEMLVEADNALLMLDSDSRIFNTDDGEKYKIDTLEVNSALKLPVEAYDGKAVFIRESFDSFFFYLDRFEHFIKEDLVKFEDVIVPTEYYISYLADEKELYRCYIQGALFKRALLFLDRFEIWKDVKRAGEKTHK